MRTEVRITGTMIRLGQLLKLAGVIDSGSEIKALLAAQPVTVNAQPEIRRGRQLHHGDIVCVGEHELLISSNATEQRERDPRQL